MRGSALLAMQTPGPCSGNSLSVMGCGSNAGWVIDLAAAGISAALVAFLLMRPHLYVFGATVGWAALAFIANFALRHSGTIDAPATYRMTAYFVVLVIAGVLLVVEGKPQVGRRARQAAGGSDAARMAECRVRRTGRSLPARSGRSLPARSDALLGTPPYFVAPVPAPVAPAAPPSSLRHRRARRTRRQVAPAFGPGRGAFGAGAAFGPLVRDVGRIPFLAVTR